MNPEEQRALATPNPELTEILKNSPVTRVFDLSADVVAIRGAFLAAKRKHLAANTTGDLPCVEQDMPIPVRDGNTITVRVHTPKNKPEDGCPVIVFFHGGGFVLGGLDNETLLCRQFTALGAIAVNVDYRLAPEHPFPVPVNDAHDALKWTVENFSSLGVNPKKGFMVGGISSGANLATVLTHLARDEKIQPPLTGAWLAVPTLIVSKDVVPAGYEDNFLSMDQNAEAPILNKAGTAVCDKWYNADPKSPLRCPVLFPSHKDLPPTYIQVCGFDPLRDDGLIYEDMLKKNGIKTMLKLYPGLPHGFWSTYLTANFSMSWLQDSVEGFKWLLAQS